MTSAEETPHDVRQGIDEGDAGYPEEQPGGTDPGSSRVRENAPTADREAERAPDTDTDHTATGNPASAG